MADEHNLRTISSYRDHLLSKYPKESVDVWGDDIFVHTPHIDSLAEDGVLYSNYYASVPACTPARGSFLTGLYPHGNGARKNHAEMKSWKKTWADVLQFNGYYTSYMGKFHLDGTSKPGWKEEDGRDFGFNHTIYRYNRGHWKCFEDQEDGKVKEYTTLTECENKFDNLEKHYSTDFLMDKGMEFLEEMSEKKKHPFALFLSISDPHDVNEVRAPYNTMFSHLDINIPRTTEAMILRNPAVPDFYFNSEKVKFDRSHRDTDADIYLESLREDDEMSDEIIEESKEFSLSRYVKAYFGMVKLIDDKVGQLLEKLKELEMDKDCIIVFTSDHGDLLGEHGRVNKNMPYETSAGIPMIIKYPSKLKGKKVIETAHSQVDFAPTLLGLLNITDSPNGFEVHGVDGSDEILQSSLEDGNFPTLIANNDKVVISYYPFTEDKGWIAAIKNGYKYIVDTDGDPTLFDLTNDPDELYNVISLAEHKEVLSELKNAMVAYLEKYDLKSETRPPRYMDLPSCRDSNSVLKLTTGENDEIEYVFCEEKESNETLCNKDEFRNHCPKSCQVDCEDSVGDLWYRGESLFSCNDITDQCKEERIRSFCPKTCNRDYECNDDRNFEFIKDNGATGNCIWLSKRAQRKEKYCGRAEISNGCMATCEKCSKNIPNTSAPSQPPTSCWNKKQYKFSTHLGERSCKWLCFGGNERKIKRRQARYCKGNVSTSCCKACNAGPRCKEIAI